VISPVDILIFAAIFALSYIGVALYRRWSVKQNFLKVPNERSSHDEPTPHGAGIVIVAICLVAYIPIAKAISGSFSWGYILGATLIAVVSFLDDIRPISFKIRLLVHCAAAVLLIVDLETWHGITMLGGLKLGWWGYLITFLWIVWMVNSYNFMDGIDGIAGLQAVIAGIGWAILGVMLGMPVLYLFAGVLAAASLGFFVHNINPAHIFMGDVGSAFIGFTFAALPLMAREGVLKYPDLLPIAAVLFLWFFIFDSLSTILRRLVRGEKIWTAHREHLFQRLVSAGFSHRSVTALYGLLASILSISVLVSVQVREDIGLIMFPVVIVLTSVILALCIWKKVLT
jgi:UDP-N-acetylmuramyl pentapeptide phosphotransferase/UDP-N-acetylglucosamine-1-phosphate transferase